QMHRQALEIFKALDHRRAVAIAMGNIAVLLAEKGEVEQALQIQSERLETNRQLGDQDGIAMASWDIARIELDRANHAAALPRIIEAYEIVTRIGRLDAISAIGKIFSQLLIGAGQRDEGLAVLRRSADGYRQLGRPADAEQVE